MALFAGDRSILTGEELTYDYNFNPFSAKNVQECRCGSENCRGVLGPRPKDQKPSKPSIKEAVKMTMKAGKRKFQEILGADDEGEIDRIPKKRKMKAATGVKKSTSSASMRMAKNTALAIKKNVSAQLNHARKVANSKRRSIGVKKTTKNRSVAQTYGSKRQSALSSRNSSLTIVASAEPMFPNLVTKSVEKDLARGMRAPSAMSCESTIRVITAEDE